jgi:hypothetical protein
MIMARALRRKDNTFFLLFSCSKSHFSHLAVVIVVVVPSKDITGGICDIFQSETNKYLLIANKKKIHEYFY